MTRTKKIIFSISAALLALCFIEIGLRLAGAIFAGNDPRLLLPAYQGQAWATEFLKESDVSGKMQYRELIGWGREEYHGKYINVDANGVRTTWNEKESKNDKKIFMFGGSTMWGSGARDAYTIPSYVAKELAQSGNKVQVTNYGEGGYTFTQEVVKLTLLLREGNIPDLAVFYDGVNDVAASYESGKAGKPVNLPLIEAQVAISNWGKIKSGIRGIAKEQCATCRAIFNIVRIFSPKAFEAFTVGSSAYTEDQIKTLAQDTKNYYLTSINLLDKLSRIYGFRYVVFWQPNFFLEEKIREDKTLLLCLDPRIEDKKIALLHRFVNAMMSSNPQKNFYNISSALSTREIDGYIDHAHLSESGNGLVAQEIGKIIKSKYLR